MQAVTEERILLFLTQVCILDKGCALWGNFSGGIFSLSRILATQVEIIQVVY